MSTAERFCVSLRGRAARDWDGGVVLYLGDPDDAYPCYFVEWDRLDAPFVQQAAQRHGLTLPQRPILAGAAGNQ